MPRQRSRTAFWCFGSTCDPPTRSREDSGRSGSPGYLHRRHRGVRVGLRPLAGTRHRCIGTHHRVLAAVDRDACDDRRRVPDGRSGQPAAVEDGLSSRVAVRHLDVGRVHLISNDIDRQCDPDRSAPAGADALHRPDAVRRPHRSATDPARRDRARRDHHCRARGQPIIGRVAEGRRVGADQPWPVDGLLRSHQAGQEQRCSFQRR